MNKRNVVAFGIVVTISVLSLLGCGKSERVENIDNTSDEAVKVVQDQNPDINDDTTDESENVENGLLFTTDYEIEDYLSGRFIVSKNGGELYGMLNLNGEEILPLKYSDLDFVNSAEYLSGIDDKALVVGEYEGQYYTFDFDGNIFAEDKLRRIEYDLPIAIKNDTARFAGGSIDRLVLYDIAGNKIEEMTADTVLTEGTFFSSVGWEFISDEVIYYIEAKENDDGVPIPYKTHFLGRDGNTIAIKDGFPYDLDAEEESEIVLLGGGDAGNFYAIEVMKDGEVKDYSGDKYTEGEGVLNKDEPSSYPNRVSSGAGKNGDFFELHDGSVLEETNGTWKWEFNGEPVQDDRYMHMMEVESVSGYAGFFLVDEDEQTMYINACGEVVIPKGLVQYNRDENSYSYQWTLIRDGGMNLDDVFMPDDEDVVIIVKSGNTEVHRFVAKDSLYPKVREYNKKMIALTPEERVNAIEQGADYK